MNAPEDMPESRPAAAAGEIRHTGHALLMQKLPGWSERHGQNGIDDTPDIVMHSMPGFVGVMGCPTMAHDQ